MRRSMVVVLLAAAAAAMGAACSLTDLDGLSGGEPGDEAGPDARREPGGDASDLDGRVDSQDGPAADGPVVPGDPYAEAVLTDGPLGWWRLEEASGTSAKDSSGAGRDATILGAGGVVFGAPGALDGGRKGFELDGAASLVLGEPFTSSSYSAFTIEAWIKPSATDNAYRRIFSKITIGATGPDTGIYLYYNSAIQSTAFEGWSNRTLVQLVSADLALPKTTFTHVVIVNDGTLSRLYVNGTLLGSSKAAPLTAAPEPPSWGRGWQGAVDELALYDKPLSAARVLAHYVAAQP